MYAARQDAVTRSAATEEEKIQANAALFMEKEDEKFQAVQKNFDEKERLLKEGYGKEIENAEKIGADTSEIKARMHGDLKKLHDDRAKHHAKTIDSLIAEEKRHRDAVKRLEEEMAGARKDQADFERDMRRKNMSNYGAYMDKRKEIAEKNALAEKAIAAGNFESARKYAQEAADLARGNTAAVEENGRVAVSAERARKNALEDSRAAMALLEKATSSQVGVENEAADKMGMMALAARSAFDEVADRAVDAGEKLQNAMKADLQVKTEAASQAIEDVARLASQKETVMLIKANMESARADLSAFAKDITDTEAAMKVYIAMDRVRTDVAAAQGILKDLGDKIDVDVDFSAVLSESQNTRKAVKDVLEEPNKIMVDTTEAMQAISALKEDTHSTHTVHIVKDDSGEAVPVDSSETAEAHAAGGMAGFSRRSGALGGYGGGDTVPALLEPGEFIFRKEAVQRLGVNALYAANRGLADIQRYASGGYVEEDERDERREQRRERAERMLQMEADAASAETPEDWERIEEDINAEKGRRQERTERRRRLETDAASAETPEDWERIEKDIYAEKESDHKEKSARRRRRSDDDESNSPYSSPYSSSYNDEDDEDSPYEDGGRHGGERKKKGFMPQPFTKDDVLRNTLKLENSGLKKMDIQDYLVPERKGS
ncbi:MAG: hypothetical protein GY862_14000 [Gammaproteobacteria bacterium]|nr:hypothetical protein [Gammaproteobacteria bacterium]